MARFNQIRGVGKTIRIRHDRRVGGLLGSQQDREKEESQIECTAAFYDRDDGCQKELKAHAVIL